MKDERKTKSQLIQELIEMRQKVKELEKKTKDLETGAKDDLEIIINNRPKRKELRTNIEFIADFDIVEAKGVNISEGGISFELYEDLPFEMRFDYNGAPQFHRANLVWITKLPFGGFRFGMMFVKPKLGMEF